MNSFDNWLKSMANKSKTCDTVMTESYKKIKRHRLGKLSEDEQGMIKYRRLLDKWVAKEQEDDDEEDEGEEDEGEEEDLEAALENLSKKELRALVKEFEVDIESGSDKEDIIEALLEEVDEEDLEEAIEDLN